jgi:hypothetical protein
LSEKLKAQDPIRSFADLPRAEIRTAEPSRPARPHVNWDTGAMVMRIIGEATETLQSWMTARLMLLNREKVSMEDITIVHQGNRTIIRVLGRDRFEFKIKCSMEER